ncbi:hypothetical protein K438DRAFT_1770624 [Mycena galopus ATCC 62051]|nr:hypothetical protein K438DRAFT_1770624 [Mycena galopus ATCC 62051]
MEGKTRYPALESTNATFRMCNKPVYPTSLMEYNPDVLLAQSLSLSAIEILVTTLHYYQRSTHCMILFGIAFDSTNENTAACFTDALGVVELQRNSQCIVELQRNQYRVGGREQDRIHASEREPRRAAAITSATSGQIEACALQEREQCERGTKKHPPEKEIGIRSPRKALSYLNEFPSKLSSRESRWFEPTRGPSPHGFAPFFTGVSAREETITYLVFSGYDDFAS